MAMKLCETCHHIYVVEIKSSGKIIAYKQGIEMPVGNDKNCVWCGAEVAVKQAKQ